MKNIYKITIGLLLSAMVLTSCSSYLDESPDNRQEIKTLQDASELLVSGYSGATYNFIEWRTDNVVPNEQLPQKKWLTENYTYQPIVSEEEQDSPTYLWVNNYNAIAHANQVLEDLPKIQDKNVEKRNAVKGEALLIRAYNHFILASVFCQAYDKATATKELGIPYATTPEKELKVNYERGTLQQTYDKIEKDLLEGIPLLSDKYFIGTGKYHFNKGAAYAFASRFFLWKGDYEKCIKYSNMLLGSGVVNTQFFRNCEQVFKGSTVKEIANKFISPEATSNLLLIRKETSYVTRFGQGYQPTPNVFSEVYAGVQGGGNDFRTLYYGPNGSANPVKYTELFRYTTATTGYPYFIMPELRSEETIFNRMEAYVNTGRIAEALADYNAYAPSRYKNGGQLTLEEIVKFYKGTEKESMMKLIIDERRKEFFREGLRWWDIKRFNIAVTHKDIKGNVYELKENDLRKAVQIPEKVTVNGIQANPR